MAERPLVTIVTPSYEQAPFLAEAIESVLAQDYPQIEYFVLDGGSRDGSIEIIKSFADRITWWTSEPDGGQVVALNRGFDRAGGELLGWLNADDVLLPGAVSATVAALEAEPETLLVYGDNVLIDEQGKRLDRLPSREFDISAMLKTGINGVVQPGSLFRRRAFELTGPLDEAGYYYFDFEFVLRLGARGSVRRIPQELALYRLHPASKSVAAPRRKADDLLRTIDVVLSDPLLPPEARVGERAARAQAFATAGEYFYLSGSHADARHAFLKALRLDPSKASSRLVFILAKTFLPARLARRLRAARRRTATA